MSRIAKADVNRALELAAKTINQAGGPDGRTSRAELQKALTGLPKTQRALTEVFFRFIDNRDFKAGAQVTPADVKRATAYAKEKMIAKYDLNSNGLSPEEIKRMSLTGRLAVAVAKELKKVGAVEAPGASVTDAAAKRAIEAALSPFGVEDAALVRSVKLREIPAAARAAVKKAGEDWSERDFGGADYSADVEGYYAVFKSAADKTVVGYAMVGYGSGEPDYQDGKLVGVNLAGRTLVDAQDDR